MEKKWKIYSIFVIILVLIIAAWLVTLKLNLGQNSKQNNSNIFDLFKDIKLDTSLPKLNTTTTTTNNIINNVADKIKDLDNWQTYRNETYGYEIKYPKDWFVYDNICNCDCENSVNSQTKSYDNVRLQSFSWPNKECGYAGLGGRGVRLTIYINNKLKNLDEWINNTKNSDPTMKVNVEKDISLAGIIGKELTLSCDCLTGVDFYRIIEKDNKIYEFSISSQDINLNNYSSTINQILSTFKFIE
ncbi:MAG TPA: PsbP-related protein [bacterium]|nr:PsbP-related protein [bacterium]HPL95602.1 PsbP-related protein [bacterium]